LGEARGRSGSDRNFSWAWNREEEVFKDGRRGEIKGGLRPSREVKGRWEKSKEEQAVRITGAWGYSKGEGGDICGIFKLGKGQPDNSREVEIN